VRSYLKERKKGEGEREKRTLRRRRGGGGWKRREEKEKETIKLFSQVVRLTFSQSSVILMLDSSTLHFPNT
jgi:hypothetical protein